MTQILKKVWRSVWLFWIHNNSGSSPKDCSGNPVAQVFRKV